MNKKGTIFIVSGPSGAGKSTVLKRTFEKLDNWFFSISATTRPPRSGETDGESYYFVSKDDFLHMIERQELLEYAEYVGNYYGTPEKPVLERAAAGTDVFLDVEVKGNRQVRQRLPGAVSIFITTPDLDTLERRLRARETETEEKILRRLKTAREELEYLGDYDHVIVNDDLEQAADEMIAIVKAQRNLK